MKNPTNTNAADAKEIQTQLAGEKGGGRAYWNAVKKSKAEGYVGTIQY